MGTRAGAKTNRGIEMREFKFRVWVGFMEHNILVGKDGYFYKNPETEDITKYDDTSKLMEYTGSFDRNGKELCEGDIVIVVDTHDSTDYGDEPSLWEIKKVDNTFVMFYSLIDYYYLNSNIDSFSRALPKGWELEVIGNIYENSELLK